MKMEKMLMGGLLPAAALLLLAGCGVDEAEKFGYKGLDLEPSEPMFFSTGPAVTNWVPARVLSVCENYEMAPEEKKLLAAAGVVAPGGDLPEVPTGYTRMDSEPWFATWTKPMSAFGLEGVAGFVSHHNDDRGVWETSESYFSSYWTTEAEAVAALAKLRAALGTGYGVKKFYDFDRCWVAEYVRLRVMGVVGQKADGRWSCMLDIQDKNRPGCGQWESVDEQQARLDQHRYLKALKAWRVTVAKVLAENHAAVEAARTAAGLKGLTGAVGPQQAERPSDSMPCFVSVATGTFTNTFESAWSNRVAELTASLGLEPAGEPTDRIVEGSRRFRTLPLQSALYDVQLNMAGAPEEALAEPAEPCALPPSGAWQVLCFERLQAGRSLPARPESVK